MLFVHFPLALVDGFVRLVNKYALAVRLAIQPIALVNVAICVGHSALADHGLVLNLTSVERAILIFDVAEAFPLGFIFLLEFAFILSLIVDLGPIVIPNQILSIIFLVYVSDPFLMC